jgi:DNA-binding LytR/AlgR family response regulator
MKILYLYFSMTIITKLLNKSYPLEENKKKQFHLSIIFGAIIFIVLYLAQPFGNSATIVLFQKITISSKLLYSLFGGIVTAIVIFIDFIFFFKAFPNYFKETRWTIGRELIWTAIIILSIGTANILINHFIWSSTLSFSSWVTMIFYTAIIGIVPAIISIILNQARLLHKYKKQAALLNQQLPQPENIATSITNENEPIATQNQQLQSFTLVAENGKQELTLTKHSFIAATSADNYVKVYYLNGKNVLQNDMLRSTLKMIESKIINEPFILRCHRTAIVNLEFLRELNGTAQGYRLQLGNMLEEIPVSRNLNQELRQKIETLPHAIHPKKLKKSTF